MTPSEVDLVEVRVGLSALTAEVNRLGAVMAPLAGLPTQLQAVADLQAERLTNHIERHQRDVAALQADLGQAEARCVERHDEVKDWQTWAIRAVLGVVIVAVLAAVGWNG
jgi:t-SNARE complex subunit (syntaxin)